MSANNCFIKSYLFEKMRNMLQMFVAFVYISHARLWRQNRPKNRRLTIAYQIYSLCRKPI